MGAVEERICDQPVLKLLRAVLRAGVMEDGRDRARCLDNQSWLLDSN
jgi:hypothetical protein